MHAGRFAATPATRRPPAGRKRPPATSARPAAPGGAAACPGGPVRPRACSGRVRRSHSLCNEQVAPAPVLWPRFAPSPSSAWPRGQCLLGSVTNRTLRTDGGATRRLGQGHGSVCRLTAAGPRLRRVPGSGSCGFCCGQRCGAPRGGCATTGNATSLASRRSRPPLPFRRRVPPTRPVPSPPATEVGPWDCGVFRCTPAASRPSGHAPAAGRTQASAGDQRASGRACRRGGVP